MKKVVLRYAHGRVRFRVRARCLMLTGRAGAEVVVDDDGGDVDVDGGGTAVKLP